MAFGSAGNGGLRIRDDEAHWSTITKTVEILQSKYHVKDVSAKILDGGDHRLSREDDIAVMLNTLDEML